MKKKYNFTIICLLSLIFSNSSMIKAQNIEAPYEVGTWQGFSNAAITYTFDDGCSNQYTKVIPMFNELGLAATFFPVINWTPNWTALKNAVNKGHEVGSHTVTHPNFKEISFNEQDTEMKNAFAEINSRLPGINGMTIAYPYCEKGRDSITSLYYFAARGCQGFIEKSTPNDFLNISSIVCGEEGSVKTVTAFQNKADAASSSKGWAVYLIHGIDGDGGYSDLSSDTLRKSLEYLKSNESEFWVGTFGNVARYIRERNCIIVRELRLEADSIFVSVSDTLNDTIYNCPLTIRRPLPTEWEYAQAWQNGDSICTKVVEVNQEKFIQFNAVPDGGEVSIASAEEPVFVPNAINSNINSIPQLNIWTDYEDINYQLHEVSGAVHEVSVFNLMGIKLFSDTIENNGNTQKQIPISAINTVPGIHILIVTDKQKVWSGKFFIHSN